MRNTLLLFVFIFISCTSFLDDYGLFELRGLDKFCTQVEFRKKQKEESLYRQKQIVYRLLSTFKTNIYEESFFCINQPKPILKTVNNQIEQLFNRHVNEDEFRLKLCGIALLLDKYFKQIGLERRGNKYYDSPRLAICINSFNAINSYLGTLDTVRERVYTLNKEVLMKSSAVNFRDFFITKFPDEVVFDKNNSPRLKDEHSIKLYKIHKQRWDDLHQKVKCDSKPKKEASLNLDICDFYLDKDRFTRAMNEDSSLSNNERRMIYYECLILINNLSYYKTVEVTEIFYTHNFPFSVPKDDLLIGETYSLNDFVVLGGKYYFSESPIAKFRINAVASYELDLKKVYGQSNIFSSRWLLLAGETYKFKGFINGAYEFDQVLR